MRMSVAACPWDETRRAAWIRLGGLEQTRELPRQSRGLPGLDAALRDFGQAFRTLRRDFAMALFAVLIVGMGVGAASTVFSIFHVVLLRPLPFEDPDAVVWIANGHSKNLSNRTVQMGNLEELRQGNRSFSGIEGYSPFYGRRCPIDRRR